VSNTRLTRFIDRGRRAMAERLVDTGTMTRASTTKTWNETTGRYDPDPPTTVYTGAGLLLPAMSGDRTVDVGETVITLRTYKLTLPWDAPLIKVDDVWTPATSADARVVGRPLRVIGVLYTSDANARRLVVEDNGG
jgi:hypothetical protein